METRNSSKGVVVVVRPPLKETNAAKARVQEPGAEDDAVAQKVKLELEERRRNQIAFLDIFEVVRERPLLAHRPQQSPRRKRAARERIRTSKRDFYSRSMLSLSLSLFLSPAGSWRDARTRARAGVCVCALTFGNMYGR